jgi:Protein of unknown function (DUF1488)
MFFTFPEDARWNADRQAVEFGLTIGEYEGVVRVPRRVFQSLVLESPTPERCVEAYYLQRTRFERIAEPKLRRRQLTEDGNVEISGRDLREGASRGGRRVRVIALAAGTVPIGLAFAGSAAARVTRSQSASPFSSPASANSAARLALSAWAFSL